MNSKQLYLWGAASVNTILHISFFFSKVCPSSQGTVFNRHSHANTHTTHTPHTHHTHHTHTTHIQYNTIQYNTIQHNTTQHNTTQHNTQPHTIPTPRPLSWYSNYVGMVGANFCGEALMTDHDETLRRRAVLRCNGTPLCGRL